MQMQAVQRKQLVALQCNSRPCSLSTGVLKSCKPLQLVIELLHKVTLQGDSKYLLIRWRDYASDLDTAISERALARLERV